MFFVKLYIKFVLNRLSLFKNNKIKILKNYTKKSKCYMKHFMIITKKTKMLGAFGFNKMQKYKVKHSVTSFETIKKTYGKYYKFNEPLFYGEFFGFNCAIFKYFDDEKLCFLDYKSCLNIAKKVFEKSNDYIISQKNVDEFLLNNLMISWGGNKKLKI